MSRDPSPRICSMVQTLDDGDGVTVLVETPDRKQAFAFTLDGDESAAFQRTLSFDRDAVVLDLKDEIAKTEKLRKMAVDANRPLCDQRDAANERARAAEEKDAKGAAAIATLQAANEKLTKTAADAEAARERTFETMDKVVKERNEAWERIKVLEGSAEPALWGRFFEDGAVNTYTSEADAWGFGSGGVVAPLYRHPPKPAGKPLAYRVVHSNGYTVFAKEQNAVAAYPGCTVTPLYEAPPVGVDVSGIRTLIEHGKQGCYDLSSFLVVLGNMIGALPAVDTKAIHKALRMLHRYGGNAELEQAAADLRAAIGEKAGS